MGVVSDGLALHDLQDVQIEDMRRALAVLRRATVDLRSVVGVIETMKAAGSFGLIDDSVKAAFNRWQGFFRGCLNGIDGDAGIVEAMEWTPPV